MISLSTFLRRGIRAWLLGPDSVAPGYSIERKGRRLRVVHLDTGCWSYVHTVREGRRVSWQWYRDNKPWKTVAEGPAPERHGVAGERPAMIILDEFEAIHGHSKIIARPSRSCIRGLGGKIIFSPGLSNNLRKSAKSAD